MKSKSVAKGKWLLPSSPKKWLSFEYLRQHHPFFLEKKVGKSLRERTNTLLR
jgi:hypothetical protein